MKKTTKKKHAFGYVPQVFSFILLISLLLSSCSGQNPPAQTEAPATTVEETPLPADQPLYLTLGSEAAATIIRPSETTDAVLDAVLELRDEIKRLGGASLSVREDFDYHTYDHTEKTELIVGYTKAPRSVELMKSLSYGEYAVVIEDNKIYVLSHREEGILQALSALRTQLLCTATAADGKNAVTLTGGLRSTPNTPMGWLESGSFSLSDCVIVYPSNNTEMKNLAIRVAYSFRQLFSATVETVPDSVRPREHEILLGKVNRPAPSTPISHHPLRANLQILDGSLWISAETDASTVEAITLFVTQLRNLALFSPQFDLPADYHNTPLLYNGSPLPLAQTANTRIMSFNLLAEVWANPSPTTGREVAAAATLLAYQPDVAGIQEVDEFWYSSLPSLIESDGYRFVSRNTADTGSTLFTTLIYNSNTVRLIESGQAPYTNYPTNSEFYIRTVVWGLFERIDTGACFIVASTHWDLPERGENRTAHASQMAEIVGQLSQTHRVPVVCTGDFNTVQSDSQYSLFLNNSGFSDAAYTATEKGLVCRTIHALGKVPTTSNSESYDHIFHSPDTAPLYYSVIIDSTAMKASDHAPVFSDFRF